MVLCSDALLNKLLSRACAAVAQSLGHIVDGQNCKRKSICLVADSKLQWSIDVALLLVSSNVKKFLAGPVIGEAVHQPRVGVESKDNGLIVGKQRRVFGIRQPMWMVAFGTGR